MNRVKHLAVILLVFVMCFGMCVPVYANGSDTLELKNLVNSTYMGGMCTVSYYHPVGYPNVWVGFSSYGSGYSDGGSLYVIYYKDGTKISGTSTGMSFSEEVYLTIVKSKAAAEDILFNGITADFQLTTSGGPAWCNPLIYTTDKFAMRENGNPKTLEAYYYDWYFEQNGFYPVGINLKLHYMCNGELIGTQEIETVAGTNILLQDIIEEPYGYEWTTININGTEYQKADYYKFTEETDITILMTATSTGTNIETVGILNKILEYLKKIVDPISGIEIDIIIGTVDTILDDALGDNDFYISVCEIQNELTKLLAQDYSDPSGFHEVNPLIFTMRRVPIASEDGMSYTYSKVDWGIQDISLIGDMKWFFGSHYQSGKNGIGYINVDGSPAVKSYSDALISAFLWISFAFTIWHRFPDLIAGEVATVSGIFGDHLRFEASESRRNEEMFAAKEYMTESSTVKGENGVNYTYTKKRRLK